MTLRDDFRSELAASLRGPTRSRRRLLQEIDDHLEDAIDSELAAGLDPSEAEREVLERLGGPMTIAARWNEDEARRNGTRRRNGLLVALCAVTALALAGTQYAAGRNSPSPPACANADEQPQEDCPAQLPRTAPS